MSDIVLSVVDILAGGALVALTYPLGKRAGRRERPPFDPDDTARYVCGCDDHLSEHDPEWPHRCRHIEYTEYLSDRTQYGAVYSIQEEPCTCQQYVGPLPADMLMDQLRQPLPSLPTPTPTTPPGEDPRARSQPATAFNPSEGRNP